MKNNTLSVIIPMKNMEQYIEECLDSILNSTLMPDEIIVIDFGSQDSSMAIIQRYAELHNNIVLLEDMDGDAASARNAGLKYARGEFVAFVDCDDWIAPNMFQVLYNRIQSGDWDVVSCNYRNVYPDEREEVVACPEYSCAIDEKNLSSKLVWMALGGMGAEIWTKLYRRSFLTAHSIGFESEHGINGEDVFFNYCVLLNGPKISVIEDILYFHRIRTDSLSHRKAVKLTKRFMTIVLKLLRLADTLQVNARRGLAQLLISLIIQDVTSAESKEEKEEILSEYMENSELRPLCRCAVSQLSVSIKRRVLAWLLAHKFYGTIVKLWH